MAVTAVISETCDLCRDGPLLPEGRTKSVSFAYRGLAYDLDVCNDHYKEVTDFFERLTQAGQDRRFALERRRKELGSSISDLDERIVDWMLGNGLPRVRPERSDVVEAFRQAEESLR
jgi:hypothetical protein